ncbi:predicted protein [Nematostella vectensis]|uniref:F5/8 type C domain-containing protein n=1 Tax=Nematostella vectensis TaxID=45351 RepID=A7T160_NEMVE|nr:predicted protein [Nematostella vectensis]|eukprot:XP_001622404.1 hypothetical protein NEMVEDRAFT_v1g233796 [Nematostella vectensis]
MLFNVIYFMNLKHRTSRENDFKKDFIGNVDKRNVKKNSLANPTNARFVQFIPTAYSSWQAFRVEVYGTKI